MTNENDDLESEQRSYERVDKWIFDMCQFIADLEKPDQLVNEHLLPCGDDLILITLKGHLIIEALIEMNLCRLLCIDSLPTKEGRLGFNQKLALLERVVGAMALPGEGGSKPSKGALDIDVFCPIRTLNTTRNALGH